MQAGKLHELLGEDAHRVLTPVHANQPITNALSKNVLTPWSGDSDLKRKQQASEQAEDAAGASGMAGTLGSALHSTLQRNQHCLHVVSRVNCSTLVLC